RAPPSLPPEPIWGLLTAFSRIATAFAREQKRRIRNRVRASAGTAEKGRTLASREVVDLAGTTFPLEVVHRKTDTREMTHEAYRSDRGRGSSHNSRSRRVGGVRAGSGCSAHERCSGGRICERLHPC